MKEGQDRARAQTGLKFRVLNPECYGREGGRDQYMPENLKELFKPIQNEIDWKQMFICCGSSFRRLARWKGYDYGICPRFLCGYCPFSNCDAAHLYTTELLENCSRSVHKVMRKGVKKYIQSQPDLNGVNAPSKGNGGYDRDGGNKAGAGVSRDEPPHKRQKGTPYKKGGVGELTRLG